MIHFHVLFLLAFLNELFLLCLLFILAKESDMISSSSSLCSGKKNVKEFFFKSF